MKKILFVDDEPHVLSGLQRLLRGFRSEWEMEFFSNGRDALARLAVAPFDVIVTDMRMPDMDGAELLTNVRAIYPDIVRICLSGYSSVESAMKVVGLAHQYLSKPCEPGLLKATIVRACALRDHLHDPLLRQALSRMENVPSLPTNYQAIIAELNNAEPSVGKVGEIVAQDMAMTAKILQLVNSSFFGLGRRVTSAKDAAALLGLTTIRGLVLSAGIFSYLDRGGCGDFSVDALLEHSLAVASTAKAIAASMTKERDLIDDAFVAGLLHDIGKLVLAANFKNEYGRVVHEACASGLPATTIEAERFGASHADVGAFLMDLWGLPSPLVEAIAFHHCPEKAMTTALAPLTMVHAADVLVLEKDPQHAGDGLHFNYLWEMKLLDKIEGWRTLVSAAEPMGAMA
jgi:putative nucleotidyltransferase with HDIG domain